MDLSLVTEVVETKFGVSIVYGDRSVDFFIFFELPLTSLPLLSPTPPSSLLLLSPSPLSIPLPLLFVAKS
jgi:hypothetical protein